MTTSELHANIAEIIQRDVSLQPFNSMAVAARTSFLATVENRQQLQQALDYAKQDSLRVLVIGEGSNTLFTQDFDGLVILNRLMGIDVVDESTDGVTVSIASGENWHEFVRYSLNQGWFGLENLALIPGLMGAAPMQNIGAYGVELKDCLVAVEYLDKQTGQLCELTNAQCQFGYRDSIFKHELLDRAIITSVTLRLSKQAELNLSYPALAEKLATHDSPTPLEVFDAVCEIRSSKLPMPSQVPNAGSFFKNPIVDAPQHVALKNKSPNLVSYSFADKFKLAAGWLIENAGWKGRQIDGVQVHQQQALVITNPNGASGSAVLAFAQAIQEDIADKYEVQLEIEPRLI